MYADRAAKHLLRVPNEDVSKSTFVLLVEVSLYARLFLRKKARSNTLVRSNVEVCVTGDDVGDDTSTVDTVDDMDVKILKKMILLW